MNKRAIAFFLPSLNGGGAERVCLNLASGFLARGRSVDVVLVQAIGALLQELPAEVRLIELKASRTLTALPGLTRYLRREDPQVVIPSPDNANLVAAWAGLLAGRRSRILAVNHVNVLLNASHTPNAREKLYPYLLRMFAFAFHGLVTVSQGNREALLKRGFFPDRKISVIYNPIVRPEIDRLLAAPLPHPWFAPDQPPVILAAGRLTPQKDYPTLLKAFSRLRRQRPARLVILGAGEQREGLLALAEQLGISTDLDLVGFDLNPFRYMARCAVFVLSSTYEGFGNVLVEALACGAQVVSTDCPSGPAEILDNGKYGRLTPVGDPQALAEAIVDALDHPLPADRLRERAQAFSVDIAVEAYLRIFEKVAEGRRRPAAVGGFSGRKVAFFLPSLSGGGAERVALQLAGQFHKRGLAVDLVLVQARGEFLSMVPAGVRIVDLQAARILTSLPALADYLRREEPVALISCLDILNPIAIWAKLLALRRTKVVISTHVHLSASIKNTPKLQEKALPFLLRSLYRHADAIVGISEGTADDLAQTAGIPREKIKVIYNPLPFQEILRQGAEPLEHPWFAKDQPAVILAVGRLVPQKDYPTLLRAFSILRKHRPARLVILGQGAQHKAVQNLVNALGIAADVELHGFDPNPYRYMARCSVLALSSAWEGFANVLAEALACGAQVVSTDCPGSPREILAGGKYGRLVPVGDPEALANAIREALDQPLPVELLQERARAFSLDKAVEAYLRVLGMAGNAH